MPSQGISAGARAISILWMRSSWPLRRCGNMRMFKHSLLDDLQTGAMALPDFLAQVEGRYTQREPSVLALVDEKKRFARLYADAENLLRRYPEPANRPGLFGVLTGVKDIFRVDGFPTQAGSRLPAGLFEGREAECVTCLKD